MKFQSKFGETINHHYRRPKHFPIICRKINLKKPNFIACAISSSAISFSTMLYVCTYRSEIYLWHIIPWVHKILVLL